MHTNPRTKKPLLISLAILAVMVGAFSYLLLTGDGNDDAQTADTVATEQKQSPNTAAPSPAPSASPGTPSSPTTAQTTPGNYTAYSESAIATTAGRKLIFFHAPWCPQCRDLEASINQGVPDGITVFKADYDSSTALRQKYGVTIQTTIVEVDAEGVELKKHVAYDDPSLPAVLKALE